MPYKYIGIQTSFKGKTLWEIVGNLKNLGVGRIITRGHYEKHPEPCFMKIVKVETVPNPELRHINDPRQVIVWFERTFRGRKIPELARVYGISTITDYQLIPKAKEAEFCTIKGHVRKERIMPRTTSFPPLLREIILRDMKAKGDSIVEEPRLTVVYRQGRENYYRVAEEGESPSIELAPGLGEPASPDLYKGIKL